MPVYRKCSQCQGKVLVGTLCKCEKDKKRESYKLYQMRRMQDDKSKAACSFYNSGAWISFKENLASHQFGLDLIEWDKGNIIEAEMHHHIIEVKEDWNKRLDEDNVLGLTQQNHMRVHAMMNRSDKDKKLMQDALIQLIAKFNEEYY